MKDFECVCPSGDFTCPYWAQGFCTIGNPNDECDDFASLVYFLEEEDDDEDCA